MKKVFNWIKENKWKTAGIIFIIIAISGGFSCEVGIS